MLGNLNFEPIAFYMELYFIYPYSSSVHNHCSITVSDTVVMYQKYVSDAVLWFPVPLQCIDTNSSIAGHIGVEYLGQEETLQR